MANTLVVYEIRLPEAKLKGFRKGLAQEVRPAGLVRSGKGTIKITIPTREAETQERLERFLKKAAGICSWERRGVE